VSGQAMVSRAAAPAAKAQAARSGAGSISTAHDDGPAARKGGASPPRKSHEHKQQTADKAVRRSADRKRKGTPNRKRKRAHMTLKVAGADNHIDAGTRRERQLRDRPTGTLPTAGSARSHP